MEVGDLVKYDFDDLGYGLVTSKRVHGGYWVYFWKMDDYFPFTDENPTKRDWGLEVISVSVKKV